MTTIDDLWIRHAQSEGNLGKFQHAGELLTPLGEQQAQRLAERLRNQSELPFTGIVTSTNERAIATARFVSDHTGLPIIAESDLLVEKINPPAIIGKEHGNSEAEALKKYVDGYRGRKRFIEGGETQYGNFRRAVEFLEWRMQRSEDNLIMFSHGATLKKIWFAMVSGGSWNREWFDRIANTYEMIKNTSITECRKEPGKGWKIMVWNDDCHLKRDAF